MKFAWIALVAPLLSACIVEESASTDDDGGGGDNSASVGSFVATATGTGGGADVGSNVGGSGPGAGGSANAGPGGGGGGTPAVCARWNADRVDMNEGDWSGNVGSCNAGDVSANGRANALKLVNLYRSMAKLSEVTNSPNLDGQAQECALMMHANGALSHNPPGNWSCYTSTGAGAAGKSNLATTPGVFGVDLYMSDYGNESSMGHRRWILSNSLGPIGLGSTDSYSCMLVIGGSGNDNASFTAFPSPGKFPIEAMYAVGFGPVDDVGWTIQSDSIDINGAQVTITDDGQNMPVNIIQLPGGYGSQYALNVQPQGWQSQAGHTYAVTVSGTSISYQVEMVTCE